MFEGAVMVGEVFKHYCRDIWVQIKRVETNRAPDSWGGYCHNWVEFDVLIGDSDRINNGEAETVVGLREFAILFRSV